MAQPEKIEHLDMETDPITEKKLFAINPAIGGKKLLLMLVSSSVNDLGQNKMIVENRDGSFFYIDPHIFAGARRLPPDKKTQFIATIVLMIQEAEKVSVLRTPSQTTFNNSVIPFS